MMATPPDRRWQHNRFYRWWRSAIVSSVDHESVVARIEGGSGWSGRYVFMTMMSAGIAVLGLLLSSPAVVIGAMLISPLMNPILGLGFSLALFDFSETRRSLTALAAGAIVAIAFTAIIVLVSPLKAPTTEILARTRPNLFDLLVALFAALAGTFAIIRGRGETIVGVAIATALMPPLAVVGYGLATWNMPVLGGSFALFVTNLMTIALAATVVARFYGFGHHLSSQQSWLQTVILILVFAGMSVPLGFSLTRIASETVVATKVRSFLSDRFGASSRVTQLDINFDRDPISIRSVVIAPHSAAADNAALQKALAAQLKRPVKLQVDQVLMSAGSGAIDAQRAELQQASEATAAENAEIATVMRLVALSAGVAPDDVTIDRDHHRASATAKPLPGATSATYRALERRLNAAVEGWQIAIVPPFGVFPEIRFANDSDVLDETARDAVLLSAWDAQRMGWMAPAHGIEVPRCEGCQAFTSIREPPAMEISTIGLDLAKNVFQVHGVDREGNIVVRRTLRRAQVLPFFAKLPPCLVGMEACGTAHHWARELITLGHDVRQMPPAYVKPYVKRGKTDAADAEAICEAVTRPTMRFVPVKSPEQQAALSMHRARDLLVKQRTQLVNMLRALLAEFGINIPQGVRLALEMARKIVDGEVPAVPKEAAKIAGRLSQQALDTHAQLREIDLDLLAWQKTNETARRLMSVPGIGPIGATALAASVTDASQFRSGREFAAWLGLTPRQHSSGGKERLGRITKMGDKYLRTLLVVGMTSLIKGVKRKPEAADPRLVALLARKPTRVATVAMANRTARVVWAIMARGETYQAGHQPRLAA